MTEEYWVNSYFSVARYTGGVKINGITYLIVDKFGKTARELSLEASDNQQKIIPPGEPCDLIQEEWIPVYKLLGRDKFIEYLKQAIHPTIEDAESFAKL